MGLAAVVTPCVLVAPSQAEPGYLEADGVGPAPPIEKPLRWREVWAGVDATADSWLVFTGMTVAPTTHIHGQGLRLRFASGYGGYSYAGRRFDPLQIRTFERNFDAQITYADVLAGYLWRFDPLIVKVFAGVSGLSHDIAPFDNENLAIDFDWGAKGVVELWLNIGDGFWGSLDMSWNQAHETRSARSRLGYRFSPALSFGLEARLDIDAQADCDLGWDTSAACRLQYREEGEDADLLDYSRGGLFVRYDWEGGEISASAGVSGTSLTRGDFGEPNPYGTFAWIMQY